MRVCLTILFFCAVRIVCSQDLSKGLVACYSFSGNANDGTGNENNGVVHGATLTTDRFGNPKSAYLFDGIDDYISIPTKDLALSSYTYAGWALMTRLPDQNSKVYVISVGSHEKTTSLFDSEREDSVGNQAIVFNHGYNYPDSTNSIHEIFRDGPHGYFEDGSIWWPSAVSQRWIFVCLIVTPEDQAGFYEGRYGNSGKFVTPAPAAYIGQQFANIGAKCNGKYFFSGIIDDISIYNRAITQQEGLMLFQNGQTCSLQPLTVNNVSVCSGMSATFSASGNSIIRWYDAPTGGNLLYEGNPFVTPVLQTTTTYYAQRVADAPRTPRTPTTVTVHPGPVTSCPGAIHGSVGDQVLLASVSSGTAPYNYSVDYGNGSPLVTSVGPPTVEFTQSGTFNATITITDANQCQAVCSEVVSILILPIVYMTPMKCAGNSITLEATGGTAYKWYNASQGGTLVFEGNPFITPVLTTTTLYYVANVVDGFESARTKVTANIIENPVLVCSVPADALQSNAVDFGVTVSSGTAPYAWVFNFGDGTELAVLSPPLVHQYQNSGVYTFTAKVSDVNGCAAACSGDINLFSIIIPDVISDNGDAMNSKFTLFETLGTGSVPYTGALPFTMSITNRWGKEIYQTADPSKGWAGEDQPAGIYYYSISLGDNRYKGWVSVLK